MRHTKSAPANPQWTLVTAMALLGSATVLATPPQVTNLLASQRSGAEIVDLSYTLDCETPACTVAVEVSTNNGASYGVPATNFTGSGCGRGVTPGAGKPIAWNAGSDWPGRFSSQVWFKVTAFATSTNPIAFTLNTNIYADDGESSIWGQPVFDGTHVVISRESEGAVISARKYDLDLNPVGAYATVADTNDTGGSHIADHKHIFQNDYHYLVFSISGSGDGGSLWLVKFDRNFNRAGIVQVVSNEPPTNDMLLFGDGTAVYVGKFYPEGRAAHKIYKYDSALHPLATYLEGTGSNNHANADAALYLDGRFYFVSPQHVGPGANDTYYRIVYDTNFNVIKPRSVILQDTNKLGTVNGLSYYQGRFIVHYCRGSSNANPIARAVFDDENWALIRNETIFPSNSYHASHSVIVGNTLFLGYTEEIPVFRSKLAKFTMAETAGRDMAATGIGYAGPVTVNTLELSLPAADFDGDGKADPVVYVGSLGTWYLKLSDSGYGLATLPFGGPDHTAIAGDFDGDGKADPAVYEAAGGQWQVQLSSLGYAVATLAGFGGAGYEPVAGDYDGDGKADPAIYHTTNGDWQVALSSQGYALAGVSGFGGADYSAAEQNYDSDHRLDAAIYHQAGGHWMILLSAQNYITATLWYFGGTGFTPVMGDFDGDGLADPAIYAEASGTWQVKLSRSGYATASLSGFGGSGDLLAAADYDGDRKADLALLDLATGAWRIKLSGSGYAEATLDSGWTP